MPDSKRIFSLFVDPEELPAWEAARWSHPAGKFAMKLSLDDGNLYLPLENDEPLSRRISRCHLAAMNEMDRLGIPRREPHLASIWVPFDNIGGLQWLGAYARFFNDRLELLLVNAWFASQLEDDEDIVSIILHELVHSGLRGQEHGHGGKWAERAAMLEAAGHTHIREGLETGKDIGARTSSANSRRLSTSGHRPS